MRSLIEWCVKNRILVIIIISALTLYGMWSFFRIKMDAIPDLSDTQVIIQAGYPGQPPVVVEDQLTYPLTTKMLSVPYARTVRGYSFFGFSLVYILFEDGTDIYWARSRVLEYLSGIQSRLPKDVKLELGPDATSVGWIYEYALVDRTGKNTLADLRDLQDFVLKYELTSVQGVSEVASIGGFRRQFQIEVDPNLLYQYNITLSDIESAVSRSNMEIGARLLQQAESEFMILAKGYISNVEDIRSIPIRVSKSGAALTLGEISHVKEGPDIRRGIAELDGNGEVVGGVIVMRQGEDVPRTIEKIKKKLDSLKSSLPAGVEFVTTYDRSEVIEEAIENLFTKIAEELMVITVITVFFLLHFKSSMVAIIILPLGIIISFIFMNAMGVAANIMSLAGIAIAIGDMVDASVVMVENTHKHLEEIQKKGVNITPEKYWQAAVDSSSEVAPGLFWSMIILIISFSPIFALPEQSGRLFVPLAFTKMLAMAVSAFLSVVFLPVLIGYFVRGRIPVEDKNPLVRNIIKGYSPVLIYALDNKKKVLAISAVLLLLTLVPIFGLPFPFTGKYFVKPIGTEFMPPLEEGDLLYMPTTIPGISVSKAREILIDTDRLIKRCRR